MSVTNFICFFSLVFNLFDQTLDVGFKYFGFISSARANKENPERKDRYVNRRSEMFHATVNC